MCLRLALPWGRRPHAQARPSSLLGSVHHSIPRKGQPFPGFASGMTGLVSRFQLAGSVLPHWRAPSVVEALAASGQPAWVLSWVAGIA